MAETWSIKGDFIDFCKCAVPCPCSWGQPPTDGDCQGIVAWRIREGGYGDVELDGLNVVGVSEFEGNIWDDDVKMDAGLFIDETVSPGLSAEDTADAIRAQGGLVSVPHPFDPFRRKHLRQEALERMAATDRIDAVEVFNSRVTFPRHNQQAADFAARDAKDAGT